MFVMKYITHLDICEEFVMKYITHLDICEEFVMKYITHLDICECLSKHLSLKLCNKEFVNEVVLKIFEEQ